MKRVIATLGLLAVLLANTAQAVITTQVEPATLALGESLRLTLVREGPVNTDVPQLHPLQTDFIIQRTEHSVSSYLINGQMSSREQWSLTLQPQKTGTLTIPSIQIGNEQSTPSQIIVNAQQPASPATHVSPTNSTQGIQFKISISDKKPYVNQAIRYTVKLYHRDQLLDSDYQPPQLNEAFIIPLGQGKHYQSTLNGELYAVEEQEYALFPQKSGTQRIKAPQLHAIVLQHGIPQHIQLSAQATTLHVKPIPANLKANRWFPASAVSLSEQYEQLPSPIVEGMTLRRTITLTALDEPAELFPSLPTKASAGVSVYPEKPRLKNHFSGHALVGEQSITLSYLLNKPGQIKLPAYTITWFDTTSNTYKQASLPARHLTVMPNPKQPSQIQPKPDSQSMPTSPSPPPAITGNTPPAANNRLPWAIASVFAVLWLITLANHYWRKSNRSFAKLPVLRKKPNTLRNELLSNDPRRAEQAILQWARRKWPKQTFHHLEAVIQHVEDDTIKHQLKQLIAQRYGRSIKQAWQGDALWQALKSYQPKRKTKQSSNKLPPINP